MAGLVSFSIRSQLEHVIYIAHVNQQPIENEESVIYCAAVIVGELLSDYIL